MMERRRRFLFRELLPGCDLMIAVRSDLCPSNPREYQWIRRCLCDGVNLDLQKRADLIKNFIKWSGPRHQSGLLTV